MTESESKDLTALLRGLAAGDGAFREHALRQVYEKLHAVAERAFRRESPDHTMQPTALLHDAWMKLVESDRGEWQNRDQFFAIGATIMRRILVDHARARGRDKRGGGARRVTLVDDALPSQGGQTDILDLDAVLHRLNKIDSRQHAIVELRFFSGLSVSDVASCLGISRRTVEAEWTMAKAWLARELEREGDR